MKPVAELPPQWRPQGEPARGGQAEVFRVRREGDDAEYALKRLIDPSRSARFTREVATMQLLTASGVHGLPPVVESGEWGRKSRPYYVMPWYSKGSLQDLVDSADAADLPARLDLLFQVARLLQAVHAAGVAHRDVKPENVLVGDDDLPLLADFGLCLHAIANGEPQERLTEEWRAVGPRLYLAPEMEIGFNVDADHRAADYWSFAKMIWVTVTGRPPLSAADQLNASERLANIEPGLQGLDILSEHMLRRDPRQRLTNWRSVLDELQAARSALETPDRFNGGSLVSAPATQAALFAAARLRSSPAGVRAEQERLRAEQERLDLAELGGAANVAARVDGDRQAAELTTALDGLGRVDIAVGGPTLDEIARCGVFDAGLRGPDSIPVRTGLDGSKHSPLLVMLTVDSQVFYAAVGLWLLRRKSDVYAVQVPYLFGHPGGAATLLVPPGLLDAFGRLHGPFRLGLASSREAMRDVGLGLLNAGLQLSKAALSVAAAESDLDDPDAWVEWLP